MSNLIGQSLGRYHILEQLGEGGMAVVYKAYDTRLECDVAIKVISTNKFTPDAVARALKRFEREAKALAKLTHPNIVKVIDYGEYEGQPYLVMPYLAGGNLKQYLRQHGRLPWQEAAHLLLPIAQALDFAHSQGVIHRDVKPANILLTQNGQPMLTDFGVAKVVEEEATVDLTGTAAAVGTPEYMAPEQTGKNIDHRVDIYALGIVFYEMLTGRRPYEADTPLAVLVKQASEPLPRPSQFASDLPDAVEKVLIKALAKDPNDRYKDMGMFAEALERLGGEKVESARGEMVREVPKSRRLYWLLGGLLGLVVLAVGIGLGSFWMRLGVRTIPVAVTTSRPVPPEENSTVPSIPTQEIPIETTTPIMKITPSSTIAASKFNALVFSDDFENGNKNFTLGGGSGSCKVVDDGTGNNVLELSDAGQYSFLVTFGPKNISNFAIEYRLKIVSLDNQQRDSGIANLFLRYTDFGGPMYAFSFDPGYQDALFYYYPPFDNIKSEPFNIVTGKWYDIRVEMDGKNLYASIDGILPDIQATDSRLTSGNLGFQIYSNTTVDFDDVKVWTR